jgi:hypothetical protein
VSVVDCPPNAKVLYMNLEIFNAIYVVGIALMIVSTVRVIRTTAKLRASNMRRHKRMETAYWY